MNQAHPKDYSHRPNVVKMLPYWRQHLAKYGKDRTTQVLKQGYTILLTRRDRLGILQALELV